jgi:hypothetical protein
MQNRNTLNSKKTYITTIIVLVLALVLTAVPLASAAAATTLSSPTATAGSTVTVNGSGFGATKTVGIGFGAEVVVTGEVHNIPSPSGTGPFTAIMNHYPIKPGSFSYHCTVSSDTNVVESDYTDDGDGTLTSSSEYALNPFVNYVTGAFGRSTSSAWDGYTVVFTASYTYYTYNVTPAAGVTTSGSGTFTAPIVVPAVSPGTYNVTALDISGNKFTATLNVTAIIPEGTSIGILLVASVSAMVIGLHCQRKRPTTRNT